MKKKIVAFFILACILSFLAANLSSARNLSLSPTSTKFTISKGDTAEQEFFILNAVKGRKIYLSTNVDFLKLEKEEILVNSLKEKFNVKVNSENLKEGVYVGKILVSDKKSSLEIPVILEVETPYPLFDVFISSPADFAIIPSLDLVLEINVYKLKGQISKAVLEYSIRNLNGEDLFSARENIEIKKNAKITRNIPNQNLTEGTYIISSIVYDESGLSFGTASKIFQIGKKVEEKSEKSNFYFVIISLIIIVILIISFVFFNIHWHRNLVDNARYWKKKIVNIKKVKFSDISKEIGKLEYQKKLLEEAFRKKYIKKKNYEEAKRKIDELVEKLRARLRSYGKN